MPSLYYNLNCDAMIHDLTPHHQKSKGQPVICYCRVEI